MGLNNPTSLANVAFLNQAQTFTKGQSGQITNFSGSVDTPFFPDLSVSNNWAATLNSGIRLGFPTNIGSGGQSGVFAFTQSSSGNCALSLTSGYESISSVAALGAGANSTTLVTFYARSATRVELNALTLTS